MPSQLLSRLNRYLDQSVRRQVMSVEDPTTHPRRDRLGPVPPNDPQQPNEPAANIDAHWPAPRPPATWGVPMTSVQAVVIHETSGWPSYYSSKRFEQLYQCLQSWDFMAGAWHDKRGIGPQFYVEGNGTAYSLLGPENLAGDPLETWHAIGLNTFTIGIENGDVGDSEMQIDPTTGPANGPKWFRLSTAAEDLTGLRCYAMLHPRNAPDIGLIWFAQLPNYIGSGDVIALTTRLRGWRRMLFTERNYRSLALLCRTICEQIGLPRNFPLFPYLQKNVATDIGDAAKFRKLILADPLCDGIATKLGTTTAAIQANDAAYRTWFTNNGARAWIRLFGANPARPGVADTPCIRGFISHCIGGTDPNPHPCPGPLFDWHRFAREMWDYWWYPFDTTSVGVTTTPRPYRRADRDTPLVEYYFDATGAPQDYNALRETATPVISNLDERFLLPNATPIYALANGVVVAARIPPVSDPRSNGFVLTRHEAFYQKVTGSDRIDYDTPPSSVWTLVSRLSNDAFANNQVSLENPDWLNRFFMRLKECELAVNFYGTRTDLTQSLDRAWVRSPTGAGPRRATGQEIELDADEYRRIANELGAGTVAFFPLEADATPTPVRVILGDVLGKSNTLPSGQTGVRIEIFSKVELPVPGRVRGTVTAAGDAWWTKAARDRTESIDAWNVPLDGIVWQYPLTAMLKWINDITWASEWRKFDATATTPARPVPRTGL